jgi:serine/threonine-protein kinase RsbW
MSPPREVRLSLDSRLENVALVGRALHGIAGEAGLGASACDELELCVVEAVTNAILHAYRGEPGHEVALRVTLRDDRLEVRITDQGTPMPPGRLEQPEPEEPDDPLLLAESGRGLTLMRRMMDALSYTSDSGHNTLVLAKRLGPGVTAPS